MGYVTTPPSGIITLPSHVTFTPADVEAIRAAWACPQTVIVPNFGIQWSVEPPRSDPRGWTERNVNALGYGLLASVGTLIAMILWMLASWAGLAG